MEEIKAVFGSELSGQVLRTPIGGSDLQDDTSVLISLFRKAIIKSLASSVQLPTDGRGIIWEKEYEPRREDGNTYHVHKAVLIFLRKIGLKTSLILKPTLHITSPNDYEVDKEIVKIIKIKVLGWVGVSFFL